MTVGQEILEAARKQAEGEIAVQISKYIKQCQQVLANIQTLLKLLWQN